MTGEGGGVGDISEVSEGEGETVMIIAEDMGVGVEWRDGESGSDEECVCV